MSLYLGNHNGHNGRSCGRDIITWYLLQTLEEWIGLPAAVIISSAMFGVGHLLNPTATGWANYVIPSLLRWVVHVCFSLFVFPLIMVAHRIALCVELVRIPSACADGCFTRTGQCTYHRCDWSRLLGGAAKLIFRAGSECARCAGDGILYKHVLVATIKEATFR